MSSNVFKPAPPRELLTPRTRLRPVTAGDADAVFEYAASPAVTKYMDFRRHTSLSESVAYAHRCETAWSESTAFPWAILARDQDEFVGVVELRLNPPTADFGYITAERFWGRGLASEAAGAVMDWVWAQKEIKRVWATCHPDNVASVRVLTKLGLELEARLERMTFRPQLGDELGPTLLLAKERA